MTQDEAHQRLRALIDSLPEEDQRRLQELDRRGENSDAAPDTSPSRH